MWTCSCRSTQARVWTATEQSPLATLASKDKSPGRKWLQGGHSLCTEEVLTQALSVSATQKESRKMGRMEPADSLPRGQRGPMVRREPQLHHVVPVPVCSSTAHINAVSLGTDGLTSEMCPQLKKEDR